MKIIVDVDGVVADLCTAWLDRYNQDYNDNLTPANIADWGIEKFVKPECGVLIYGYLDRWALYNKVLPIKLAPVAIKALRSQNHEIFFATSATPGSMGIKFRWLEYWGFEPDTHHYIETSSKGMIRGDLLIDDYPKNLEEFEGEKLLFDQPWNRKDTKLFRAYNWENVLNIVDSMNYREKRRQVER